MKLNKKNWIGNNKSTYVTLGASNHSEKEREKNDYYATDPKTIKDLLQVENFNLNIWEPACGEGHLSKELIKRGYNVLSTDKIDRGFGKVCDFLKTSLSCNGDIITNPPYKYAQEFVEKSIEIIGTGNKVAMFLKLQFLEGQKRNKLFKKYPPKVIYVWQKGFQGNPIVRWIL